MFKFLSIFIALSVVLLGFQYTLGQSKEKVDLSYVVDGDTIRVKLDGRSEYVRLIGINAPETNSEIESEKCQGYKSKEYLLNLLKGKEIRLESDSSQANKDRYNRLLRYVFVGDQNINLLMLKNGYAREYTYSKPYRYQKEFVAAQEKAESNRWGLWRNVGCQANT